MPDPSMSPSTDTRSARRKGRLTLVALLALVSGALIGILLRDAAAGGSPWSVERLEWITGVWIDLLRLIVVPVVATSLYLAVRRLGDSRRLGGLGTRTLLVLLLIVAIANVIGLAGGYLAFSAYLPELSTSPDASAPSAGPVEEPSARPPVPPWPVRLLEALLSTRALLGAILGSIVVGLLAGALPGPLAERLDTLCERAARAVDGIFQRALLGAPVAAFTLALTFSMRQGLAVAGALGWYVLVLCTLLALMTILLYPLGAVPAGIGMRRWAEELLPAQVLAVATRSSLATVPAVLDVGRRLRLPESVREFVVPFAASTFKASTSVSGPMRLVFLSMVFDVRLTVAQVAGFLVADMLISVADVGVPRVMPQMKTLPLYLALGIPAEGYLLVRSTAALTDVSKTVVNTTGFLTAAGLVSAWQARRRAGARPAEAVAE